MIKPHVHIIHYVIPWGKAPIVLGGNAPRVGALPPDRGRFGPFLVLLNNIWTFVISFSCVIIH